MKTITLFTFILLISIKGFSQVDPNLNIVIKRGLTMIDSAKTEQGFQMAADYFESIAAKEQKEWFPCYYAAFCQLQAGLSGNQGSEIKDLLYDRAQGFIEKADLLSPDNSEIYALKGYILFSKMLLAPQSRARTLTPLSTKLIIKAIALNKNNPRARLLLGINTFYTPEAYSGGKSEAKPLFQLAKTKFAKQRNAGINPSWGAPLCNTMLQEIN